MKKKWLTCFFIYAIIIVVIVAAVLIYKGIKSHYGGYVQEEVVVENKISIKAKEIHDYMRENNYGYCTYDSRCEHEGECGLNTTFESSKNGAHNTCCATYVSWVLQETGYITKKEHVDNNFNAANNLSKYLENHGWRKLEKGESLQPGDILCFNHHVAIYGGRGAQYDAGNKYLLTVEAPCKIDGRLSVSYAEKVLRAPDLDNVDCEEKQNEV